MVIVVIMVIAIIITIVIIDVIVIIVLVVVVTVIVARQELSSMWRLNHRLCCCLCNHYHHHHSHHHRWKDCLHPDCQEGNGKKHQGTKDSRTGCIVAIYSWNKCFCLWDLSRLFFQFRAFFRNFGYFGVFFQNVFIFPNFKPNLGEELFLVVTCISPNIMECFSEFSRVFSEFSIQN